MIPTKSVRAAAAILLAADAATLAPAALANHMTLVKEPIIPGESLVFADITVADFDGSTAIDVGVGTQPSAFNPGSNDLVIDLKPPAGGFRWETTGVTNLPQTIYGYVLLNNADDTILAAGVFDTPIELTAINQRVDGLDATISQQADSMY